jgi:hypothetical protein
MARATSGAGFVGSSTERTRSNATKVVRLGRKSCRVVLGVVAVSSDRYLIRESYCPGCDCLKVDKAVRLCVAMRSTHLGASSARAGWARVRMSTAPETSKGSTEVIWWSHGPATHARSVGSESDMADEEKRRMTGHVRRTNG